MKKTDLEKLKRQIAKMPWAQEGKTPLIIDSNVIIIDVAPEVQEAFSEWVGTKKDELNELLEPFGLDFNSVDMITLRRPVYVEELEP